MTGLVSAAREVRQSGTFEYINRSVTTPELIDLMKI